MTIELRTPKPNCGTSRLSTSLATKAVKGDISAIKYINEICLKGSDTDSSQAMSITVRVVD